MSSPWNNLRTVHLQWELTHDQWGLATVSRHRKCLEELWRSKMAVLQTSHAPQRTHRGNGVPVMLLLMTSRYFWLCGALRHHLLNATVASKVWTLLLWNLQKGVTENMRRGIFFLLLSSRTYWLKELSRKSIQIWLIQVQAIKEQTNSNGYSENV